MNPNRWPEIDALFQSALERPPGERRVFLLSACHGDSELLREVESLIAHHDRSGIVLDAMAAHVAAEMAQREPIERIGIRIAHYQTRSLLGAGGMGEVYLAQDTTLGRQVALKLLPERFTADPERVRRFEQEARAASALNHPNIVTIHQIGQAEGTFFIVTEFIEGQTLRQRMADASMTLEQALDVAIQVASALGSAHAAGIIHRDIKPENIMLRPDGLVKVLDFGLAKLAEREQPVTDSNLPTRAEIKTVEGIVMGTPQYMSPEQARGQSTDERTDIFSFGVVLYEMVAARPPFTGASTSDVIAAILKEEPPPIARVFPASSELERIVRKALSKDTEQRYHSVKDMEVDLKRFRQEMDLEARLGAPRKEVISRRKAIWIGGTAAAAALSALAAWRVWPHSTGIRSLAVLPFVNAANDEDADWLSTGICETLIRQIQQLPALRVMAFSTVLNFKGKTIDPREAGRILGVPAIVTGRVTLRNEQVKVSAELVDVATGASLWANTYERSARDIISIQDEIAQAIVNEGIKLRLSGDEERALGRHLTDDPEAYELFQRGVRQADLETEEGYLKARENLKAAIARDQKFAEAFVALAGTYTAAAADGYQRPTEAWQEQKRFIQRAAELDPTLPGIHLEAGSRAYAFEWDWAAAEREFELAVKSTRRDFVETRFFAPYALERWAVGHPEDSLRLTRQARQIDPLSNILAVREAHYLRWTGRVDEAIDLYNKVIHDEPGEERAYPGLSDAYIARGLFDEALDVSRKWLQVAANAFYRERLGDLARTTHGADGYSQLERALAQIELEELAQRKADGDYVSPLDLARTYARLGDKEQAFRFIDAAFADRSPGLVFLNVDPVWKTMRDDPRFGRAVANVGLPQR
jgi:serine/threonine-protein kinase